MYLPMPFVNESRMLKKARHPLVVFGAEIEVAIDSLRQLPGRASLPRPWDRAMIIEQIRRAVGPTPIPDFAYMVAPGVYAIVVPFGTDMIGTAHDDVRWQVRILVRAAPSGTSNLIDLGEVTPKRPNDSSRRSLAIQRAAIVITLVFLLVAAPWLITGR